MGDAELDAIRQRRMAQLMAQQGGAGGGMGGMGGGMPQSAEEQQQQQEQKRSAEEMRQQQLMAVMTLEARARLQRIALVKPEKARAIEDQLLRAARVGQITEKVSEERLIAMLEKMSESTAPKITIQRRRVMDDD